MKKWKYLKGDESDFVGAPEWATVVTGGKKLVGTYWAEKFEKYAKCENQETKTTLVMQGIYEDGQLLAERQIVEDDEQDLNDCIGAPEARNCSPEESRLREGKIFDASQFLPEGYPSKGHVSCRCHTTPLEFGAKGDIPALIAERGSRYGKFKDGADIMQSLKDVMREVDGWNDLTPSQKEALEMIQHKVGRILNGDPNYDDSWKDIAGYATLIVNELNGEVK